MTATLLAPPQGGSRISAPDVARPGAYFNRPAVAILPAHEQTFLTRDPRTGDFALDDAGQPVRRTLTIGPGDLEAIAADANARAALGNFCPVYLGHTIPGEPDESKQPRPVGFMRNYRVGPRCDDGGAVLDGLPHLVADLVLETKFEDEFPSYPHRSIEMVPDFADPSASRVRGLALLRRPPLWEMGLLTYSAEGAASYSPPPPEPGPAAGPTPESPAGDEFMTPEDRQAFLSEIVAAVKAAMAGDSDGGGDADLHAEGLTASSGTVQPAGDDVHADDDDMPEAVADPGDTATMNAGETCPGPASTFVPGLGDDDEKKKPEPETLRMSHEAANADIVARLDSLEAGNAAKDAEIARLNGLVSTLKDKADEAVVRYQRTDMRGKLVALADQGVEMDIEAELNDVFELPAELRDKYVEKIGVRYARNPMGGGLVPTEAVRPQRVPSEAERMHVVNFMTRKGLTNMAEGRAAWNAAGCPAC